MYHYHIYYSLKNKKDGLDKMQEAYFDMAETFANKTYEKELILTKRIFKEVKNDLVCKLGTFLIYFLLDKIVLLLSQTWNISQLLNSFYSILWLIQFFLTMRASRNY